MLPQAHSYNSIVPGICLCAYAYAFILGGNFSLASFPDLLLEIPDPCLPSYPPTGYQLKSDTSVVKWIKEDRAISKLNFSICFLCTTGLPLLFINFPREGKNIILPCKTRWGRPQHNGPKQHFLLRDENI